MGCDRRCRAPRGHRWELSSKPTGGRATSAAPGAASRAAHAPTVINAYGTANELVSMSSTGERALRFGDSGLPTLSAHGRFVTFVSSAGNLVPDDDNGVQDLFLRDRVSGTTERINRPREASSPMSVSTPCVARRRSPPTGGTLHTPQRPRISTQLTPTTSPTSTSTTA